MPLTHTQLDAFRQKYFIETKASNITEYGEVNLDQTIDLIESGTLKHDHDLPIDTTETDTQFSTIVYTIRERDNEEELSHTSDVKKLLRIVEDLANKYIAATVKKHTSKNG